MWVNAEKFLLYAMLDRDQFKKVEPLVAAENSRTLKLTSVVQILYFGVSFIGSMGVKELADKQLVYGIGTVIPFVILIIHLAFSEKHPALIAQLVRCTSIGILLTGLLCTLICTPGEMTILLLVFFFCVPMLFVALPIDVILLVLVTDAVYYFLAPYLKSQEVLTMDMIDIGIFSTLSVILGMSQMLGRYRRYWLETEAVDLAKVRYRAAFIDQLTGAFNRNAYNKDTEQPDRLSLTEDFLYIAADLNGLKAANDTYGHVAGDELIIGAAHCMQECFADYGKVYRSGGDEFIIIANTKGKTDGELLDCFNESVNHWKGALVQKMSVSYGVVRGCEISGLSLREIELLADKRMYQAKADYYKNSGMDRRKISQ